MPERKNVRISCCLIVFAALLIGTIIGAVVADKMGAYTMESVKISLDGYMYTVSGDGETNTAYIFFHSLIQNVQIMLLTFMSGLSVLSVPIAPAIVSVRSLSTAFACACFTRVYGFIGGAGAFLAVGLPAFFNLFFTSYAAVLSMENTTKRFGSRRSLFFKERIGINYVKAYLALSGGMVCVSLLDAFFTPRMMGFFARLIG